MRAHNRIAKNTMLLYVRMAITMAISFYTVRVVLDELGVEDYGIYNVIGGMVALFSFLPGTMSQATQRFFSHAMGQGDGDRLRQIFSVNTILYLIIAIVGFVALETIGLWFINNQLKIPPERFEAAQTLYHLSTLSFIVTITTTPLRSIIISHENMDLYAYISIGEAFLKLVVVYFLAYLPGDPIVTYGGLVLAASFLTAIVYLVTCLVKYDECQFKKFYWDRTLAREIVGFTGWTLFGQVTNVARNQAMTVLINQYFNPVTVAARVVAINLSTKISILSKNFNVSINPPIIKAYSAGEKEEMFSLIYFGSKITFFLMWILALPMLVEMDGIVNIWLKNPPPEAALFARLVLVEVLIFSVSSPLAAAARAPGKMAKYELILGSIQFGIFIVSWISLAFGAPAYSIFIVAIVANLLMYVVRLWLLRALIGISFKGFTVAVMPRVLSVAVISGLFSFCVSWLLPNGAGFIIFSLFICVLTSLLSIYFLGLDPSARNKAVRLLKRRFLKRFSSISL